MPKPESVATPIVSALVFLVAFSAVRFVTVELRKDRAVRQAVTAFQDGSALDPLRDGSTNPYTFVRAAAETGGPRFQRSYAAGAALAIRRQMPGSTLTFDQQARIHDLGVAYRGAVGFRGRAVLDGSPPMAVRGEVRTYFHDDGAIGLEALCIEEWSQCEPGYGRLIEAAETRLIEVLDDGTLPTVELQDMLPWSDECSLEHIYDPHRDLTNTAWVCIYEPAIVLSLAWRDRAGTIATLEASVGDPELLRIVRGSLRN